MSWATLVGVLGVALLMLLIRITMIYVRVRATNIRPDWRMGVYDVVEDDDGRDYEPPGQHPRHGDDL